MRNSVGNLIVLCCATVLGGCSNSSPSPVAQTQATPAAAKSVPIAQTGTVQFEFTDLTLPQAVAVLDGNEYRLADLSAERQLAAGPHELTVRDGPRNLFTKRFHVVAGKRKLVEVRDPNRAAAEWVLSVGGGVRLRDGDKEIYVSPKGTPLPSGPLRVTWVGLMANPGLRDTDLENLAELVELEGLELWHNDERLTNDCLKVLANFPNLRLLNVDGDRLIDNAGVAHLKHCRKLRRLTLSHTRVSDAGLSVVGELSELVELHLHKAPITDAGLAHLAGLSKLESLTLSGPGVTGSGIDRLKALPSLKNLGISGECQPSVWTKVRELDRLETLGLNDSNVDDAGLEQIKGIANVRYMEAHRTRITDAGVEHLKGWPKLRSCGIDAKGVTKEAWEAINKELAARNAR